MNIGLLVGLGVCTISFGLNIFKWGEKRPGNYGFIYLIGTVLEAVILLWVAGWQL